MERTSPPCARRRSFVRCWPGWRSGSRSRHFVTTGDQGCDKIRPINPSREETVMPFGSLWLPVVVSAVAVFIVSSIVHMVLRYHRADYKRLPDEDSVAAALRKD